MKSLLFFISASCLAGSLIVPGATTALDAESARRAVGGECYQQRTCTQVATCNTYNNLIVINCPLPGGASNCFYCEFGSQAVTNCVVGGSGECDRAANGTNCGVLKVGHCDAGNNCIFAWDSGDDCDDGPNCDSDCP